MAIAYDAFLPEVLPFVRNCPDPTIESAIRLATIELCEKTEIWQAELDPISAVEGQWAYDLEPPANTSIHRVLSLTGPDGRRLDPVTTGMLDQRSPDWRNNPGTPVYFIRQDEENQLWLAPPPQTAQTNAYLMRVILKPTITSSSASNYVMTDYRDTIVYGAITRLLRMPDRDWSNFKTAAVYYGMFQEQLVIAEKRARKANEGVVPVVHYGGIGSNNYERKPYESRRTRFI
jgi:hypothetical protein